MKNKPKKLAAILELDKKELKYLIHGVKLMAKEYNQDYDKSLHDKIEIKLETAINSFD